MVPDGGGEITAVATPVRALSSPLTSCDRRNLLVAKLGTGGLHGILTHARAARHHDLY